MSLVTAEDPSPSYAALASERSLRWHRHRGLWVASHPDVVREVLNCPACRVRPPDEPVPAHLDATPAGRMFGRFARMRDGDDHLRCRRPILSALAVIDPEEVRAITLAQAAEMPAGDLDRFAFELPVRVVASMLGVPDAALATTVGWTRALVACVHVAAPRADIEAGVKSTVALDTVVRELLRSPKPPELLAMLDEAFQAEGILPDTAIANVIGLLFQTHDAMAGLIGNTVVRCSRRPEAADEPIDTMVEEVARCDPPVHNTRRFVARDTIIAGRHVAAGDTILVVLAAAGAAEPDRMWTFGHGAHACPGRSMALAIASGAVESLVRRRALPAQLPVRMRWCPHPAVFAIERGGVLMIAVIFEVWPASGQQDRYLDIAADLRPLLDDIDGFISIERFQSLTEPGKILSLSFWRDEEAVRQWRTMDPHRSAQRVGRSEVFHDYRLRIASVIRDYTMTDREQVPLDSRVVHDHHTARVALP